MLCVVLAVFTVFAFAPGNEANTSNKFCGGEALKVDKEELGDLGDLGESGGEIGSD